MAKKTVTVAICDTCGVEEEIPFVKAGHKPPALPKGWVHVTAQDATHLMFARDLCKEHGAELIKLAGQFKYEEEQARKAI